MLDGYTFELQCCMHKKCFKTHNLTKKLRLKLYFTLSLSLLNPICFTQFSLQTPICHICFTPCLVFFHCLHLFGISLIFHNFVQTFCSILYLSLLFKSFSIYSRLHSILTSNSVFVTYLLYTLSRIIFISPFTHILTILFKLRTWMMKTHFHSYFTILFKPFVAYLHPSLHPLLFHSFSFHIFTHISQYFCNFVETSYLPLLSSLSLFSCIFSDFFTFHIFHNLFYNFVVTILLLFHH